MSLPKAEIARLRALQDKKHREAQGLFVVEGEKVVAELLAAGFTFTAIYATDGWAAAQPTPAGAAEAGGPPRTRTATARSAAGPVPAPPPKIFTVTAAEMARISHYPTPSPVLAVGRIERLPLPAGALDRGLTLALDGIQDPGNVGTLLRVADWFGLDRVLLSPDCADLFSQKVINASMGSFARMRVHTASLAAALAGLPVPVLGCDLAGTDVHALPPVRDAVVVVGSEGRGLSAAVRPLVTQYVTIPRLGRAESLNAAVAAAIVCDNLRRAGPRPGG